MTYCRCTFNIAIFSCCRFFAYGNGIFADCFGLFAGRNGRCTCRRIIRYGNQAVRSRMCGGLSRTARHEQGGRDGRQFDGFAFFPRTGKLADRRPCLG